MQPTEFIWQNGTLIPWHDAQTHVLTHSLHYGAGAFEGIRMYQTAHGPAIFRLNDHIARLCYSTSVIHMTLPYDQSTLLDAVIDTVRINKLEHCYIRPLAYYGYGKMGVNPIGAPVEVIIACWPWGAYLTHDMVDIKTSSYQRISNRTTVADAKLTGNYLNSIFGSLELQNTHYHEALFLDDTQHIAEGPGENIFFVKNGSLITPNLGSILAGITRNTILTIAQDQGHTTEEKPLTLEEAYTADEAFFTGTAAEVTPIRSIDDKIIGTGKIGPITQDLKQRYLDIVHGKNDTYRHYLTYI